ncbi:MAG: NADPH-dependent FMN reductase [Solirubrobacteraceae bacterium]
MRVLGIVGSLRADSHNRRLLRAAADELPPGTELVPFETLKAVEPFDESDEHESGGGMPGADALIAAIRGADAILFVTPEYNGSIPGVLKNAVDWASRPTPATSALANKPVAVIGASTSMFGAVWAQAELRKALGLAGARVLDQELAVPTAHEAFKDDGRLARGATRRRLREILAQLVTEADPAGAAEKAPATPDPS